MLPEKPHTKDIPVGKTIFLKGAVNGRITVNAGTEKEPKDIEVYLFNVVGKGVVHIPVADIGDLDWHEVDESYTA